MIKNFNKALHHQISIFRTFIILVRTYTSHDLLALACCFVLSYLSLVWLCQCKNLVGKVALAPLWTSPTLSLPNYSNFTTMFTIQFSFRTLKHTALRRSTHHQSTIYRVAGGKMSRRISFVETIFKISNWFVDFAPTVTKTFQEKFCTRDGYHC